jgi:ketosteroid isomerase-like protein
MSTTSPDTAADLAARDRDLNEMLLAGKLTEALEKHYHEDVVMQENEEPPTKGKAANREREQVFLDNVKEVHGVSMGAAAVGDGVSFSEWTLDFTLQDGQRVKLVQVAVRRWQDGLVISERFYHG